jgi:hypothetical protein
MTIKDRLLVGTAQIRSLYQFLYTRLIQKSVFTRLIWYQSGLGLNNSVQFAVKFSLLSSLLHSKNSVASVHKRTLPTERPPLVSEVSANFFADRGCHVVSVTNPYGRILAFLDRSRYYFFQVPPQLYSRGWVDTVSDQYFFLFPVMLGNRTRDLRIYSQELWLLDHRSGPSTVEYDSIQYHCEAEQEHRPSEVVLADC